MAHPAQPPRRQSPPPHSPQPRPPHHPFPQPTFPPPQYPQPSYPQQQYPVPTGPRSGGAGRVVLRIVLGIAAVLVLVALLTPGADEAADSGDPDSCGSSEIFDSGSITTTCGGEVIYSDTSGNGYSSDG